MMHIKAGEKTMVLGLTGGVGCGKSTVAGILRDKYGAKLILTDNLAKELMLPGMRAYDDVVAYFGEEILCGDGRIDSKRLSNIVFNDEEKLAKLNSLTHPAVMDEIKRIISLFKNDGESLIVLESAMLVQTGCDSMCDAIWFISARADKRRDRLMSGRGYSFEKTDCVMKNQEDDETFADTADVVIYNNGSIDDLTKKIDSLVIDFLMLAAEDEHGNL